MRSLSAVLVLFPLAINALNTTHFLHYYPFYNTALGAAYQNCTNSYVSVINTPTPTTCKIHMSCLISNIDEVNKADMASATVLLGLSPALLAMVGPNIAELSLLSSRRPVLSFLMAMSAPALNIGSLFEFQSPVQALRDRRQELRFTAPVSTVLSPILLYGIVVLQYILVLGSIVNVVANSIQLGVYTVVSWKCQASYMPILWTSLTVVPWLFAFLSAKLYHWETLPTPETLPEFLSITNNETSTPLNNNHKQTWLRNEFSTFHLRPYYIQLRPEQPSMWASGANSLAWISVYALLWFGTLAMSSLLFISTVDALSVIMRFLASAVVARLVLLFELRDVSWVCLKGEEIKSWEDRASVPDVKGSRGVDQDADHWDG